MNFSIQRSVSFKEMICENIFVNNFPFKGVDDAKLSQCMHEQLGGI